MWCVRWFWNSAWSNGFWLAMMMHYKVLEVSLSASPFDKRKV
jgi:hypothetical protein